MTTTDNDALIERLWEAIAEARDKGERTAHDVDSYEVVAAVLPIVAEEVRKAKAEALRGAAERARRELGWATGGHTSTHRVRHWLRALATEHETGDSDEHR